MSTPSPDTLACMLPAVLTGMERKEYKRHRRDNIPLLFAFRTHQVAPGRTAIVRTLVPSSTWRTETAGVYDTNPADDLEALAAGLSNMPEPAGRTDAFGRRLEVRAEPDCRTGVVACALWARAWGLPPGRLMDEESALRSLRGERVLHADPRRVGVSLLNAHDLHGRQYQIMRTDKAAPEYAMTGTPVSGWHPLPDQSDTRIGFALGRLTAALASGVLSLPG